MHIELLRRFIKRKYFSLLSSSSSVARQPNVGPGHPQKPPPFLSVQCYSPQIPFPNVRMSYRTQSSHLNLGLPNFPGPLWQSLKYLNEARAKDMLRLVAAVEDNMIFLFSYTFHHPNLKSFKHLPFRRNSVRPVVASSYFVTVVFLQIGLSGQCQPPANLAGRGFLLGLSSLADRFPFLSVGSSLLRPCMTWPLKCFDYVFLSARRTPTGPHTAPLAPVAFSYILQ